MSLRSACLLLGPSKYDVPAAAPASSPHGRSAMGRNDIYPRPDGADSASQRSAGSFSQHSSQDGAVLGRFPKPAAMFRTPAATPSLEPGLVNSLLRQQADRDETIRRLNDRVLTMEGTIATLKGTNAELMSGQKRLHEEMHELKGMQRASAEQQDRVAARLERSQDEILNFFHNQKMSACSPAARSVPAAVAPIPAPQRFSAQSPQVRRRVPAQPSPASRFRPIRSSPISSSTVPRFGGSGSEEQPVGTPQRRPPPPADAWSGGKSIRTPSEVSLYRGLRPSSPAPSCAPSCTPSAYVRRAAIKQDLFDDDEDVPMMTRPPSGAAQPSLESPAAAPSSSEMSPPAIADRIVVPLGTARPSVILGATSLSHSGSKRRCAPLPWQSRQFAREQQARQEALYALGGVDYMDDE